MNKNLIFDLWLLLSIASLAGCISDSKNLKVKIAIDSSHGHAIEEGCSGFNVRIADKVWSYSHPDFREAVHELQPGWLRYFSGTMGDAFNSATGLYDKDYAMMFDHQNQYFTGYEFTQVKGPHRLIDLYQLLGEVGGRLVVTINGFSETPQIAHELARFCKNNNIEVEVWQFCNEPYFYVPHRDRYWWNDGYDYATKMKPYADAIKEVFPDANLALNCTWDGIWGFMKEIHKYQQDHGAYWNVFSKHSYAPHVGGSEPFEKALKRANTKVIEATSSKAMKEIEAYSWEGVPMLITEFGVWNRPLNGIISAIYNVEYSLRQLEHTNTFYIGSHEISNKIKPAKNYNNKVREAYRRALPLYTDSLITGRVWDDEGKSLALLHEATSNSSYTWHARVSNNPMVMGLKNKPEEAIYARAFEGNNGYNYLLVTNRSGNGNDFSLVIDDQQYLSEVSHRFMSSDKAENQNVEVENRVVTGDKLIIPPYSVNLYRWVSHEKSKPSAPRIYQSEVVADGIQLKWWKRSIADGYKVYWGHAPDQLNTIIKIENSDDNAVTLDKLPVDRQLYFTISAFNEAGESELSSIVTLSLQQLKSPQIFKTARRDTTITLMWESVPNASGYKVYLQDNDKLKTFDAKNTFGYRIEGLKYDVPYKIWVKAYNGLGYGPASDPEVVTCRENLPLPARNVSAREMKDGNVLVKWIAQDTIHHHVMYRIYRGTKLHDYEVLAEGISANSFVDKPSDLDYYYTVKAYTPEGECDFYPNTATVIKRNEQVIVEITSIEYDTDVVNVKVVFDNIKTDGDVYYGISVSDISYLNVEESIYKTELNEGGVFEIAIPKKDLIPGRKYAVKAFVNTNGKSIYSLPPHSNIKID